MTQSEWYRIGIPLQGISESAQTTLTEIADQVIEKAHGIDAGDITEHTEYMVSIEDFRHAFVAAQVANHTKLDEIVSLFTDFQTGYAHTIKDMIIDKKDALDKSKNELEAKISVFEKDIKERDRLKQRVKDGDDDDTLYVQISEIVKRLGDLPKFEQKLKEVQVLEKRYETALSHLDTFLDIGTLSINFQFKDPKKVIDELNSGTYEQPATLSPIGLIEQEIHDIFGNGSISLSRSAAPLDIVSNISLENLPECLSSLVQLWKFTDTLSPRDTYTSSKIVNKISEGYSLSAGITGSYLEKNPGLFGLVAEKRKGTQRRFYKTAREPLTDEKEFLSRIIPHLRPQESGVVNKHYITQALDTMREVAELYDGFDKQTLIEYVHKLGLPITLSGIGANLKTKKLGEYGLTLLHSDEGEDLYTWSDVILTGRQQEIRDMIFPEFGNNPITPGALQEASKRHKYTLHERVAQYMIKHAGERYRKISNNPLTITLKDGSETPSETLEKISPAVNSPSELA